MGLSKTGTCPSCGYEKIHCICNNKNQHGTMYNRNTSGETQKYQYFQNYSNNPDDYSETARIYRHTDEQKFMEELNPVNEEYVTSFIARTAIATEKLIEHSMYKHIYGGRKPWPSHTATRYCPVCTLCQFVNLFRDFCIELSNVIDISNLMIHTTLDTTSHMSSMSLYQD